MSSFIGEDFMLNGDSAKTLYHGYAEQSPIFDFHCHLSPKEIAENHHYSNLTELWLSADHYKWRLMRANGIEEKYITGSAEPYEKLLRFAHTIPRCIGNPLYHWTHLELKRYFNIDTPLNPQTAPQIWNSCNEIINHPQFSAQGILKKFYVNALATTDDPTDNLTFHRKMADDKALNVKVLPTFRPDKALQIQNEEFVEWIAHCGEVCGIKIDSFEKLIEALESRAIYFKSCGCKSADQSFASPDYSACDYAAAEAAFKSRMAGSRPNAYEANTYQSTLIYALGKIYHRLGFVMQLHLGVIRNNNLRMLSLGPDTGFDTIGDTVSSESVSALLNRLDKSDELPQTVIYSLNENDNAKIAALAGCYQSGPYRSKIQSGAAWWFNDHCDGMLRQMKALASVGVLGNFIGMVTDSRSFLSYTRHEYFRRILCNMLGKWMDDGEVPYDFTLIGNLARDICYGNAADYFHLES